VALEMMKHGLPIIASAVPGMGELFEHQRNALLISIKKRQDGHLGPELNDDSLYEKMELLLNDKALAGKIAKNAKEDWKLNFTAERMGKETINVYKKCLPQQQIRCNLKVMIQ
jgi:glycosyltransferase involved in cell wall biosynthesis